MKKKVMSVVLGCVAATTLMAGSAFADTAEKTMLPRETGKIASVDDDTITLTLATMPEFTGERPERPETEGQPPTERPTPDDTEGTDTTERVGGGRHGKMGMNTENMTFDGETITITISDSVTIYKMPERPEMTDLEEGEKPDKSTLAEGEKPERPEPETISLSDISTDDTVMVQYDESGENIVSVMVIN